MLLILLAFLLQAWAVPVSMGPQTMPTIAHTIIWGIEPRADGSTLADRTMMTIIRSCLLTIAACVYRAIHQNIPDPNASWGERQIIRIKITIYALIAPEAMIWWAMRQWFGAREIVRQVNEVNPELKWTLTHGHFAQMGGLGRWDNERILHPPTFIELLKSGRIDMEELRRVSKKRIDDHSKGDILSKGVVALQTTWFVFECITRLCQHLPLIELEVVTLAFATLNTLTYLFWWDKPLDVLCPIYLRIKPASRSRRRMSSVSSRRSSLKSTFTEHNDNEEDYPLLDEKIADLEKRTTLVERTQEKRTWLEIMSRPLFAIWTVMAVAVGGVWAGIKYIRDDILDEGGLVTVWFWLVQAPFLAVADPLRALFSDDEVDEEATHISTFYGMKIADRKFYFVWLLSCLVGTIFGAIHFLSWHSSFPSHIQLLLWRISSIVLVAQPFCFALTKVFLRDKNDFYDLDTWREGPAMFFGFISGFLGPPLYISARLCVLVIAFLSLRDPPSGAFQSIPWTTYIPHL